jgi:ribosomal protein S28E/S33
MLAFGLFKRCASSAITTEKSRAARSSILRRTASKPAMTAKEPHQHARKEGSSITRNVLTDVQVTAIVLLQDLLLLVATVHPDVKVTPLGSKDQERSVLCLLKHAA